MFMAFLHYFLSLTFPMYIHMTYMCMYVYIYVCVLHSEKMFEYMVNILSFEDARVTNCLHKYVGEKRLTIFTEL